MRWFNVYGLGFMLVIMIPNIVFAVKCRGGFRNKWTNRYLEAAEQAGRFGCFAFMVFNVPGTCLGWRSGGAFAAYLIVNGALTAAYCIIWIICFRRSSRFRSLALSAIPSALFLFSGAVCRSALLTLSAVLFAPSHVIISCKNAE